MSKTITLIALALSAHLHAVEHDASGNALAGRDIRFVSSDDTLFTVKTSDTDPMAVELCGLREGSGVLSVYDAHSEDLHISYDVVVQPAVAVDIELENTDGSAAGVDTSDAQVAGAGDAGASTEGVDAAGATDTSTTGTDADSAGAQSDVDQAASE